MRRLFFFLALPALVFAACGGGDDSGDPTNSTATVTLAPSDDPATVEPNGAVTAIPFPGNSAEAVAVDENGVWVVDPIEATVTRIDPDTDEVAEVIDVPGAVDVTADETGVWVASESQGIVPIDPTTATAAPGNATVSGADYVEAGGGELWASLGFEDSVVRIDPATLEAGPPISVGAFPTYVAVGDDAAYVSNLDDRTITRIDAADDSTSEISLGEDDSGLTRGGGPIAYGGGSLWAEGTDTELCQVSPDGADVECVDIGTDINAIAADETRVWIAATDGQVLVVFPGTLDVVATIETGGVSLDSIAIGNGEVWVTDASANDSTVFRIDA
jgi:hypothetical protein